MIVQKLLITVACIVLSLYLLFEPIDTIIGIIQTVLWFVLFVIIGEVWKK